MARVPAPTIIQKPAHPNNYAVGRVGGRNGQKTDHHVVGSADSAVAVFQNPNRQASSTYIVTSIPGVIYQAVSEGNTSYADGNMASNRRAITIEHEGDWRFGFRNQTVIDNAAHLTAWLRDRGIINHKVRHREVSLIGTICCADLPTDEIWNKATEIINQYANQGSVPNPVTRADLEWVKLDKVTTYELKIPANLWSFNETSYGAVKSVKQFAQGDRVEIYGYVKNKTLGSTYLLTEYSFTQKITNGFNQVDAQVYVAPPPPVQKPEWEQNLKNIEPVKLTVLVTQTPIVNLNDLSAIKQLGQGTAVDFVARTTVKGVSYLISSYSREHGQPNGILESAVGVPAVPPNNEKPTWLSAWYDIEDVDMYTRADTDLVNLEDGSTIKTIKRGEKIRVASMTEWFGHKYAITQYSTEKKEGRGIRLDDLDLKPVDNNEPITPAPEQPDIKELNVIIEAIKKLLDQIVAIFTRRK